MVNGIVYLLAAILMIIFLIISPFTAYYQYYLARKLLFLDEKINIEKTKCKCRKVNGDVIDIVDEAEVSSSE